MTHTNRSGPLWLFDLDNTLHDAGHAIFPEVGLNMSAYIARVLGLAEGAPAADALRQAYLERYGATVLGMVRHHAVAPHDFLRAAHQHTDLAGMIRAERGLARLLRRLPGKKILFTNAPGHYARAVVRHLGLGRQFAGQIAIEAMRVHGQLRPKPSTLMLRRLLRRERVAARSCVLVEDTLANLRSAKKLGMRTAWVTQYLNRGGGTLNRPAYVDVKVKSVLRLPARLRRLR